MEGGVTCGCLEELVVPYWDKVSPSYFFRPFGISEWKTYVPSDFERVFVSVLAPFTDGLWKIVSNQLSRIPLVASVPLDSCKAKLPFLYSVREACEHICLERRTDGVSTPHVDFFIYRGASGIPFLSFAARFGGELYVAECSVFLFDWAGVHTVCNKSRIGQAAVEFCITLVGRASR